MSFFSPFSSYLAGLGTLLALVSCSTPAPDTTERLPASAPASRYRSYYGEKLPVKKENASCKRLPSNLRSMFYEQFLHLSESRGGKITQADAVKFSKILDIAWSQGHGNSSLIMDSLGGGELISSAQFERDNLRRDKTDHLEKTSLESRKTVLSSPRVKADKSTRVGLFQFKESDFEGSAQAQAQWKAIRALAVSAPEEAADRCGSRWMFDNTERELAEAFTETAECKPADPGCLRKWATLCPNLGLSYELSGSDVRLKKAKSTCKDAFSSLLRK